MSTETTDRATTVAPPAEKEVIGWEAVLQFVKIDSKREPEKYLGESTVPHGGE